MEMNQYFTYLVLGVCATHIVWAASAQISAWRDVRKRNQPRTAINSGPIRQRGDWYVFFSCADLVGPDPVEKRSASVKENRTQTPQKYPRPQTRPSVQR